MTNTNSGEALDLIDRAREILVLEPNVIRLNAPLLCVGDIHGQYYDLQNLVAEGGAPGEREQYLFLGDYVDRGSFSCEVSGCSITLLTTLPSRKTLLIGLGNSLFAGTESFVS